MKVIPHFSGYRQLHYHRYQYCRHCQKYFVHDILLFSGYPLDHQSCKFLVSSNKSNAFIWPLRTDLNIFYASMILKLKISQFQVGSYIHDNTQINFSGKYEQNINSLFLLWTTLIARYEHDVENQRAQQYVLKCVNLGPNDTVIHWANKSFSQTGFQVHFFCFSFFSFFHFCFFVFFFSQWHGHPLGEQGTCSLWNILLNFWRDLFKLFEKLGWPRNWSSGIFTNRALSSLKTLK